MAAKTKPTRKNVSAKTKTKNAKTKAESVPLHRQWLKDLRYGQSLSLEFFTYNAWILIVVLVAVLSLIGLRYKTKTKMSEIKTLSHKLELAQSDKLRDRQLTCRL